LHSSFHKVKPFIIWIFVQKVMIDWIRADKVISSGLLVTTFSDENELLVTNGQKLKDQKMFISFISFWIFGERFLGDFWAIFTEKHWGKCSLSCIDYISWFHTHLHHESMNLWKKNQIFIKSSKNVKLRFEGQSDVGIR